MNFFKDSSLQIAKFYIFHMRLISVEKPIIYEHHFNSTTIEKIINAIFYSAREYMLTTDVILKLG